MLTLCVERSLTSLVPALAFYLFFIPSSLWFIVVLLTPPENLVLLNQYLLHKNVSYKTVSEVLKELLLLF